MSINFSQASLPLERGRIAIPAKKLLLLKSIDPPENSNTLIASRRLVAEIHQRLTSSGVQFKEQGTSLVYRVNPGEAPTDNDLTVLIIGNWTHDDLGDPWRRAADDINGLVNRNPHLRHVGVEIVGWHLIAERLLYPIEKGHPLVAAWPRIRQKIHSIINDFSELSKGWQSIDVLRIEYVDFGNSVQPVMISISVDRHLEPKHWIVAEKKIVEELSAEKLADVRVEFKRGTYINSSITGLDRSHPEEQFL